VTPSGEVRAIIKKG